MKHVLHVSIRIEIHSHSSSSSQERSELFFESVMPVFCTTNKKVDVNYSV